MKRKILAILVAFLMAMGGGMVMNVMVTEPVEAAGDCPTDTLLGFKPWYQGLQCESDGGVVMTDVKGAGANAGKVLAGHVWRIVLNVIFDLSLAVGYIAMAMVIYAGYLYIMSQGDVAKAAKGQKTMVSAVIGIIIALGASVIVNTVIEVLGVGSGKPLGAMDATAVQNIFNWFYTAAGLVAVIFIIKSGFDYLTSTGNPAKIQKATKGIIFSVVGLIIVIAAAAITTFVINAIGGAAAA